MKKQVIVPGNWRWRLAQVFLRLLFGREVALSGWKQAGVSAVGCYTQNGKVLMLRRSGGTEAQTKWGLVGGMVKFGYAYKGEADEALLRTLQRETEEETGFLPEMAWLCANAILLPVWNQWQNKDFAFQGDFSSLNLHFGVPLPPGVVAEELAPTKEATAFRMVGPDEAEAMLARGEIAFPWEVEALKRAIQMAA